MADAITITLPLPPKQLSPNGRSHWRSKAKAVKSYRTRAAEEAMVAAYENPEARRNMPWSHATIAIAYYHRTSRFADSDNIVASLKAGIDGLVDGGLLTDDRDVTYLPVTRLVDGKNPRVEVTIQELTGE